MKTGDPDDIDEFRGLGEDIIGKKDVVPAPGRVKKTRTQKVVRVILKRSGLSSPPPVESLFHGKVGVRVPISKIGFICGGEPKDKLLKEIANGCVARTRLNKFDVPEKQVVSVGSKILKSGRMMMPIVVASDPDTGVMECVSGRCRLAFLAAVYGAASEIPVYIEVMDHASAKMAVAVANESRSIKALERASFAVVKAGAEECSQDELYEKMATDKASIIKYCASSVFERGYPRKLKFKISERSSLPDGAITTFSNVERFWAEALPWEKGVTTRKDFETRLSLSIRFLNALAGAPGYNFSSDCLSAPVMSGLGIAFRSKGKEMLSSAVALKELILGLKSPSSMLPADVASKVLKIL